MDLQRTMNILKRIVDELWDLLIKKELDGLDADDKKRIGQLKKEVKKVASSMNAKGIKNSSIQRLIQLAKELIDELQK